MNYDWGKYINGKIFIEYPMVINNGELILTNDLKNKEDFKIKKIKYEEFPGIQEGYYFSNYWVDTDDGIIQKWKKEKIPTGPSGDLKVIRNQYEIAVDEILQVIELLKENNKKKLTELFKENEILEPIYRACSDLWETGNVYKEFVNKKYTIKQLFELIGLHNYLLNGKLKYIEDGDFYQNACGQPIITYCYIKRKFYEIDSLINFTSTGNITYLKMSYTYLYTLFDEYILKCIEFVAKIDMRTIISYMPNISIKDVIDSESKNQLTDKIVNQLSYKMGWNSIQDKIEFLKNCGISMDKELIDNLILIGEKRNIIVHNQGIVNADFLNKINKIKTIDLYYKIGDKLDITIETIKTDSAIMKKYVEEIHKSICDKFFLLPYC